MNEKNKWDLPTRILHWSIAISLIGLMATALLGEAVEDLYGKKAEVAVFYVHLYLGFFSIGAVSLRIIWGFVGNQAVNWRGIASGLAGYPAALKAELDFLTAGRDTGKRAKSSHNPLAIPVYLGALLLFIVTAATGLSLWPHLEEKAVKHGVSAPAVITPAAAQPALLPGDGDDEDGHGGGGLSEGSAGKGKSEFAEEIHEIALFWLPIYLLLHLGGVFIHYLREDKNVLRKMLIP